MTPRPGNNWIQGTLSIALSILITLGLVELGLRFFYPKYETAAEAEFQADSLRITSRPPNTRHTVHHPDNGSEHLAIYNNHGMRQNRDFLDGDLENAVNVGFFGDSYMENLGMAGPYSFTEPLDYLLNLGGRRYNVLNFGQSGYGTDQAYIAYRYTELAERLNHVYYVFCINDIRNIYENDLFYLDGDGALQRNPALESPWWVRLLSRLHVTYLFLDGYNRINPRKNAWEGFDARMLQEKQADDHIRERVHSNRADAVERDILDNRENEDLKRSLEIFQAILKEWNNLAAANGASFSVVLLPTGKEQAIRPYIDSTIRVVDLYELFSDAVPDYDYDDWHFENDGHWAEAANRLAAAVLYRDVAGQTGLAPIPQDKLDGDLYTYYSAFDYGWMPDRPVAAQPVPAGVLKTIADRYAALERKKGEAGN